MPEHRRRRRRRGVFTRAHVWPCVCVCGCLFCVYFSHKHARQPVCTLNIFINHRHYVCARALFRERLHVRMCVCVYCYVPCVRVMNKCAAHMWRPIATVCVCVYLRMGVPDWPPHRFCAGDACVSLGKWCEPNSKTAWDFWLFAKITDLDSVTRLLERHIYCVRVRHLVADLHFH